MKHLLARFFRHFFSGALLCGLLLPAYAQSLPTQVDHYLKTLDPAISASVWVESLKDHRVFYQKHSDQLMIPASTLKLVTAAMALHYLGPRYQFNTQFSLYGHKKKQQFSGDILLAFQGDPTFNRQDIQAFMHQLHAKGVRKITGRIFVNYLALDQETAGPGWMWDELKEGYATNVSALVLDHNEISVSLHAASVLGAHATLKKPWVDFPWHSKVVTVANHFAEHCQIFAHRNYVLSGCMPIGRVSSIDLSLRPYPYLKRVVADAAEKEHITLALSWFAAPVATIKKPLWWHMNYHSPKLTQVIHAMLVKSDNLVAEILFKTLGRQWYGMPGTWSKGASFFRAVFARWPKMAPMRMVDGSGLSRYDAISAKQMAHILRFMANNKQLKKVMLPLLPQSGEGFLTYRLASLKSRIWAKSGSMLGVQNLAGFIDLYGKNPRLFVVFLNQIPDTVRSPSMLADHLAMLIAGQKGHVFVHRQQRA